MQEKKFNILIPFILTIVLVAADQAAKFIVVQTMPIYKSIEILGDFFRITHVRNTAIAFSIGHDLPQNLKSILFLALPIVLLTGLTIYYFVSRELKTSYRWIIAAILGGGTGNMIDRLFQPLGVVDFFDVKFYGIFGLERWPTFNIADSAVVIAAISLFIVMLKDEIALKKATKKQ